MTKLDDLKLDDQRLELLDDRLPVAFYALMVGALLFVLIGSTGGALLLLLLGGCAHVARVGVEAVR